MPNIDSIAVSAYTVPTDQPESDGTLAWDSTTMILVEIMGGGRAGIGYTYNEEAAARLIASKFKELLIGEPVWDTARLWDRLSSHARNLGRPGLAASAISACDVALWDLKAKLLDQSLVTLLGPARNAIPVYGSGGFTSYNHAMLAQQLGGWVEQGITRVKMKVGRQPDQDLERVKIARAAIGPKTELFVDANGAYAVKQALALAQSFYHDYGVTWFEEPVSSEDLNGLKFISGHAPAGMEITAGEYGWNETYFRDLITRGTIDVLQPDATRCMGVTGFMIASALCRAFQKPLSAHTSPTLHSHLCCASLPARHLEYFHDHVRIENLFFDGALALTGDGYIKPDPTRPGLGIELKRSAMNEYKIFDAKT